MAHTTIPTRSSPTPDVTPGSTSPAVLPRRLGLWSAIAVVVGITIGSGIFRTPAGVTNRLFDVSDLVALLIESESQKAA